MPELQFLQVDAFTDHVFGGNPAVVFRPGPAVPPGLMQSIATEMNVSETCFLVPQDVGYGLRWFTPKVEVDLCGHATLAAAHSLWYEWGFTGAEIRFDTLSGPLTAKRRDDMIWMDFPSEPPEEVELSDDLAAVISTACKGVGQNRLDFLVELESEAEVQALRPDLAILKSLRFRGLIVTARAGTTIGADFVSRYFAPYFGIDEDPVTGSAHCALGPYWRERLGKSDMVGYQASERGGWVHVHVGDERVQIGGSTVVAARGTLSV